MSSAYPQRLTTMAVLMVTAASGGGCGYGSQTTADYFWENAMGSASAGVVTHSSFVGNSIGIEPGVGWTVTMPPLLPVIVGAIVLDPAGALDSLAGLEYFGGGTADGPNFVTVSGVQDTFYKVIAEISLEVTFSESWHDVAPATHEEQFAVPIREYAVPDFPPVSDNERKLQALVVFQNQLSQSFAVRRHAVKLPLDSPVD